MSNPQGPLQGHVYYNDGPLQGSVSETVYRENPFLHIFRGVGGVLKDVGVVLPSTRRKFCGV